MLWTHIAERTPSCTQSPCETESSHATKQRHFTIYLPILAILIIHYSRITRPKLRNTQHPKSSNFVKRKITVKNKCLTNRNISQVFVTIIHSKRIQFPQFYRQTERSITCVSYYSTIHAELITKHISSQTNRLWETQTTLPIETNWSFSLACVLLISRSFMFHGSPLTGGTGTLPCLPPFRGAIRRAARWSATVGAAGTPEWAAAAGAGAAEEVEEVELAGAAAAAVKININIATEINITAECTHSWAPISLT